MGRNGIPSVDISGRIYGALTVIGPVSAFAVQKSRWSCRCVCGNIREVPYRKVIKTTSPYCWCGVARANLLKNPIMSTTHGFVRQTATPQQRWTRSSWQAMISRCGEGTPYTKKGIEVCEWWKVFENFVTDMGLRPSKNHWIERVDNTGDYCPDNCIWATASQQNRNRCNNALLTFNGVTKCKTQWAEDLGLTYVAIKQRLKKGWSVERTLSEPLWAKGKYPRTKKTQ